MNNTLLPRGSALALSALCLHAIAAPSVSRLTPPSELFSSGQTAPVIARFLPGQRFDLQATVRPDDAAKSITSAQFSIDGAQGLLGIASRRANQACRHAFLIVQ